ncbi:sulfurtransferase [Halothiobacillus neapolitanus]|uniref:Rhodanese domain protein n=1 Tax=Halothiobacillus neapolitanus (strain ATCC 23641 / DSM 15147 / CIP 104769 / NCIMB 8539 / c2) TaxID=555778 RepID=D0KWR4_HALNC|nr:rhodanese-like domain-containing protein [Halothiobacillus neapolitanus]ACX95061.1 Rhodanese domain protein [Halothiobacillus neapolitanus c2]TDN60985.1 thiosulfate/3-mercaptopyruvate sulfurtransferase [Halothiobacillus neapolitanus]
MRQRCLGKFAFWCFFSFLSCAATQAHATAMLTLPGPVVCAQWLHAHSRDVQIVDVRDDPDSLSTPPIFYTQNGQKHLKRVGGHIPSALSVDFLALRNTHRVDGLSLDFQFPTPAEFQSLMQSICLQSNEPIVIAPTGDSAISLQEGALLALELTVYGVPTSEIALLNGGTHAWITAGFPISTNTIFPASGSHWRAKPARASILAHTADVRRQLDRGGLVLDARPLDQFVGITHSPVVTLPGRIQGATALPAEVMYTRAEDGSWHFLTPEQYRNVLAALDIEMDSRTKADAIVYCNTGQYAAGAWFILNRIIGDSDIRSYEGSLYNWEHHGLPVVGLK